MSDVGIDSYADYRDQLETNAGEFGALFNTILINVTSVFRDADALDVPAARGESPELLAQAGGDEEIRVWSAGCSSGEGGVLRWPSCSAEALGLEEALNRVKIYGTDVDDEERCATLPLRPLPRQDPRTASPPNCATSTSEQNGSQFSFRSDLAPPGHLRPSRHHPRRPDLSSPRPARAATRWMYFNVEAQTQIIDRFHFALRELLFLGKRRDAAQRLRPGSM
ncbi:CheR family methyltransferase [Streptomyces sp. KL116D]|uniref:CheR family methyltransferase n=1 Tax=Streptomyces sp. KL116D TaxID=3045152 RepID=UPI0035584CB9